MELTTMFIKPKSRKGKEISTIPTYQSSSSRFHKFVPVVIERYKKNHVAGLQEKFKFIASSDMTVSQLVSILRRRMKLSPSQGYHLLYSRVRTSVMMSQLLGAISSEYKDSTGVICFTFAAQNTFGCPAPRCKPIKSKFPGIEPNPFGAPEPQEDFDYAIPTQETHSLLMQSIVNVFPSPNQDTNFDFIPPFENVSPNPNNFFIPNSNLFSFPHSNLFSIPNQDTNFDFVQSIVNSPLFMTHPFPMQQLSPMTHNFTQTDPDNASHVAGDPLASMMNPVYSPNWPLLQALPLDLLVQELNHVVPLWRIPNSPLNFTIQGVMNYDVLANSLTRLVQALHNHVPSEQNPAPLPNLPPPQNSTLLHFMSSFLQNPYVQEVSGQASLATQATHTSQALNLANQVLARLQEPSNPLPFNDYSGLMNLTALIHYFNQVSELLEFQSLVSPFAEQSHMVVSSQDSEQHLPMPEDTWPNFSQNLNAVFNPSPSWYLNDSDSLSEEDGDFEYFCDILL